MNDSSLLANNDWLSGAVKRLADAGVATSRLDCLVLLEDETGKDRSWLLTHPEFKIDAATLQRLNKKIMQRAKHVPLAYIRGKSEFFGREFLVSPAVLEPRPESETMIEILLDLPGIRSQKLRLADVGCGSGALGITAQLELPNLMVDMLEIDEKAIKVARINVANLSTGISVIKSDLLRSAPHDYEILLCNLPYVPDNFQINPAAMNEPRIAIFGGPDGLNVYRRLFAQIAKRKQLTLFIFTEALPPQHKELAEIARAAGYKLVKTSDFVQLFAPA